MSQVNPSESTGQQDADPNISPRAILPLLYHSPRLLNSNKHGKLSLRSEVGFGFASDVNSLPLNMVEITQAAKHYPVVFTDAEVCSPIVILGLRRSENLYVNVDGEWEQGTYIPAYARRYPFIVSKSDDGKVLNLCIDETEDFLEEGDTRPLFTGNEPSTLSKNAIEFCRSYDAAAGQTEAFVNAIREAGLLVSHRAEASVEEKEPISLTGFSVIDEQKLAKLSAETFLTWREAGWLPYIYAHLNSASNWQNLHARLKRKIDSADSTSD